MTSYEVITGFAGELIVYLDKDNEDKKMIDDMKEMWTDIQQQRQKQHKHIQTAIEELIGLKEEELQKNPGAGEQDAGEHMVEERKLKQQIQNTKTTKEETEHECEAKNANLEQLQQQRQQLKAERDRIKDETNISLPKARYDVNLYSHITNIRWRYDCQPNEVIGYMCDKNSVRPFSFDRNQVSDSFTVNYLWDLMEEDW
ncbi:kinetochore protein Spc24-like [Haliotis rubra]|uniref:kinetochore protein Spc24-like n=1 Tax=Haliotis rubra TaxID=36100 RepID=UPI001EE617E8|nr:kinetochore protein Spc24-like [Haliotis rubra]